MPYSTSDLTQMVILFGEKLKESEADKLNKYEQYIGVKISRHEVKGTACKTQRQVVGECYLFTCSTCYHF